MAQRQLLVLLTFAYISAGLQSLRAQLPSVIWATRSGGTNVDYGYSVAVDPTGNCFVTGYFSDTATFGDTNIVSAGGIDIFVAKYDSTGRLAWVRQAGGSGDDEGLNVACDSAGNCFVTGYFSGTACFGPTNLVSSGTNGDWEMFLAKYNEGGDLVWVGQAGGAGNDAGYKVVVDTNGNAYVSGTYSPPAVFGNVTLRGLGGATGGFLAKYDPNGSLIWAKDKLSGKLALDEGGNLFVTGAIATNQITTFFLAKYDSLGNTVWLIQPNASRTTGVNWGNEIAVDSFGHVVLTGTFSGDLSLGGMTLSTSNSYDGFLGKWGGDGSLIWLAQIVSSRESSARGITTDSFGNSFVSGMFSGSAEFGNTNLISFGDSDDFLAKYDNAGTLMWVIEMGGSGYDDAEEVVWHPDKGLYFTGGFNGQAAFGNAVLTSMGGSDIFLARIAEVPLLTLNVGTNEVMLSWPTNQTGFLLESATNLSSSVIWVSVENAVQVEFDRNVVLDSISNHTSFYRLHKR